MPNRVRKTLLDDDADPWTRDQLNYIHHLKEKSSSYRWLHNRAALYYRKWYYVLGIPSVVLPAIAGMSSFAAYQEGRTARDAGSNNSETLSVFVAIVNLLITIITAIQTFTGLGQKARAHEVASRGYSRLARAMHQEIVESAEHRVGFRPFLAMVNEELDKLSETTEPFPEAVTKEFEQLVRARDTSEHDDSTRSSEIDGVDTLVERVASALSTDAARGIQSIVDQHVSALAGSALVPNFREALRFNGARAPHVDDESPRDAPESPKHHHKRSPTPMPFDMSHAARNADVGAGVGVESPDPPDTKHHRVISLTKRTTERNTIPSGVHRGMPSVIPGMPPSSAHIKPMTPIGEDEETS